MENKTISEKTEFKLNICNECGSPIYKTRFTGSIVDNIRSVYKSDGSIRGLYNYLKSKNFS